MANTIRNVTIVVPVLMTSCQVSEKPNNRPRHAPRDHDGHSRDERERRAGRA